MFVELPPLPPLQHDKDGYTAFIVAAQQDNSPIMECTWHVAIAYTVTDLKRCSDTVELFPRESTRLMMCRWMYLKGVSTEEQVTTFLFACAWELC